MLVAHSRNEAGRQDPLERHLRVVADLAAEHAASFGGEDFARWAGLLHDVGKASSEWQQYLAECELEPERRHKSVDHKGAGVVRSQTVMGQLAFLIQGHHGGLPGLGALLSDLKECQREPKASMAAESISRVEALGLLKSEVTPPTPPRIPPFVQENERSLEFFLRMCFSALVDADHFDTERHFTPERTAARGGTPDLPVLIEQLEASQRLLMTHAAETSSEGQQIVNALRAEVYRACEEASAYPPGFFRLTVPTGGGKTRSGLAFALKHARQHGLKRVIVAVPYLTITDQTAQTYRDIFADDRAVLEHHSGAGYRDGDAGAPTPKETWRRLATQDWAAPVIVTTTVQLFESLFGRSPGACRKLHRIAESVIVLDEAQTLPFHLRTPIFDVLNELVAHYRVSVVLCTATQPSLEMLTESIGSDGVREIAPDPPRLFRTLERVRYEWPARAGRWSWEQTGDTLRDNSQGMAVLNTIANALSVLDALDDPEAFHLSTLLCGAHRRDVLDLIHERLAKGQPCRVVSTQVVEAGVDLDFPLVLRALGPLDRIVQAAGRCNREGKLETGRVVVFDPEEGTLPSGAYRAATDLTTTLLHDDELDLNHPATFPEYFKQLAALLPGDRDHIQRSRTALEYEKVADDFKMIEDDAVSVFVPYRGLPSSAINHEALSGELLAALRRAAIGEDRAGGRELLRRAQPYLVSVRRRRLDQYERDGLAVPLFGDLWEWRGTYDNVRGLNDAALDPTLLYVD